MNQMIKLLQYADDTLGIIQDDISAKHFLQVIIDFGHISGLTLNMTKTEAVWLGVNRNIDVHVPRIERYSENSGEKLVLNLF